MSAFPVRRADAHFGFLAAFVSTDNPPSSALTPEPLGWEPAHPGLIDDLDRGRYLDS
ncbi:MAG: hypothetical protein QOD87_415 [Pseudonocardiales bacterium]|nr:hypothetical protein [Pseudonocardiales bacterium]